MHTIRELSLLENKGVSTWIAPHDVALGANYGDEIIAGIEVVLAERPDLAAIFEPLLIKMVGLKQCLEKPDREIVAQAKASTTCRLLMTAPGGGPMGALAFVARLDNPARFARSRRVGPYPGLTPQGIQSGEMDYSGRISKQGDEMVRALLHGTANSLLTVARRTHPLKDWARRVKKPDQPQEGLRGAGPQDGGDPAPDADDRRGFCLAIAGEQGGCQRLT